MKSSRQAVLRVSFELLEQLLPDWQTAAMLRFGDLSCESRLGNSAKIAAIAAPLHKALKLPRNCRITGISHNLHFDQGQIAFRIECPDFRETPVGDTFSEVQAVYENKYEFNFGPTTEVQLKSASGYFFRWDGLAVETKRVYDCNGLEVGIPFPDEVSDELDKYFERKSLTAPPVEMDYSVTPDEVRALRDRQPYVVGGNFVRSDADLVTMGLAPLNTSGEDSEISPGLLELMKRHRELIPNFCWKCSAPTIRRLPDGTAECEKCKEQPLF